MSKKKLLALAAFVLPALAHATPQTVLGVSYTLPAGWKAEVQPVKVKPIKDSGHAMETQQVKLSGTFPPLTGRLQVTRAAALSSGVDACQSGMNKALLTSFAQRAGFKTSGDKAAQYAGLKGCLTEFSYSARKGFVMYGRVFTGLTKGDMIVLFVASADQKTAQGLKPHTIRFKGMDALLNSLSIK